MGLTRVKTCHFQLVEHPIRLPPPVMLCLSELRLAIVSIEIRIESIVALVYDGSKTADGREGCIQMMGYNKLSVYVTHCSLLMFLGQSLGSTPGYSCGCVCMEYG